MTSARLLAKALLLLLTTSGLKAWAQEQLPLPDGCDAPFAQAGVFGQFFEKTIRGAVVENGTVSQPHVQLFTVNRIRKFLTEKFPNPAQGDVIDKHIQAQICAFSAGKQNLTSLSPDLHQHLVTIAPKLLRDVKKLTLQLEDEFAARKKLIQKFEARQGLIDKAESQAERDAQPFLTKF